MRTWMMLALLAAPSWATEPADPLLEAIELPNRADRLRKAGVDAGQLREALQAARDAKLPAKEAEDILENEEKAVKEHGPVDNFGAFVQQQLQEGKRGRELAQAIREEHARQGKGKGHDKDKGPDGDKGKGPDGDKGKGPDGDKGKGPDGDKGHGGDKDKGHGGDKEDGKGKGGDKAKGGKGKGKNK